MQRTFSGNPVAAMKTLGRFSAVLLCLLAASLIGCQQDASQEVTNTTLEYEHDDDGDAGQHHEHAEDGDEGHVHDHAQLEDFGTGVTMLEEHYEEIKVAFEAGKPDDAHDALHCIGEILENLPRLAKQAELTDDQVTAVQQAVDKMFEAYGQVDDAMHHNQTPDYAAVADSLDTEMAVLKKLAPQQ